MAIASYRVKRYETTLRQNEPQTYWATITRHPATGVRADIRIRTGGSEVASTALDLKEMTRLRDLFTEAIEDWDK